MSRTTAPPGNMSAALRKHGERLAAQIRVAIPAKVISFSNANATVDVVPLIHPPLMDGGYHTEPSLKDVPVVYGGTLQHRVRFPLSAGDQVLLIFLDHAIDEWALGLLLPEVSDPQDKYPAENRSHDYTDCVALPLATFEASVRTVPSDSLELQNGDVTLALTDAGEVLVHAGGTTDQLVKKTAYAAHVHPTGTGPSGVPTNAGSSTSYTDVLKAE